MSRRRELSAEERALFESALKDAAPIKKPAAAKPKPGAARAKPKISARQAMDDAFAPIFAKPSGPSSGLDGHTAERLRRGALEPEARLDLHGMTEAAAHRALATFLRGAAARGCRLVLVVTGKGLKPGAADEPFDLELDRRTRGVLKAMTPRWLAEPELSGFVADVRTAHRRHGGGGALYVYLRKPVARR